MTIPTYKANVGQYNVPSMNNSGEQANNNLIFEGLASFNKAITSTAMDMYENEKVEEAKIAGAEAGSQKDFDPSALPTSTTKAQKAYNAAAIQYYANSFNTENTKALNELRETHKNNPAQYYVESEAYLEGASKNIPAHLKNDILYPLQVHSQANYNTLLKSHSARQEQILQETASLNAQLQADELSSVDMSADNEAVKLSINTKRAALIKNVQSLVASNRMKADKGMEIIRTGSENLGIAYLSSKWESAGDLESQRQVRLNFMQGKTGIEEIDKMSISQRYKISSFVAEKQQSAYKADLELMQAERKASSEEFEQELVSTAVYMSRNNLTESEEKSVWESLSSKATTPQDLEKLNKLMNREYDVTFASTYEKIDELKRTGNFNASNLSKLYIDGGMSYKVYRENLALLNDAYTTNTTGEFSGAYKSVINRANSVFQTKVKGWLGEVRQNAAHDYFEQEFNDWLRQGVRSYDEILNRGEQLMDEAVQYAKTGDMFFAPVDMKRLYEKGITEEAIKDAANDIILKSSGSRGTSKYSILERSIPAKIDVYLESIGTTLNPREKNTLYNKIKMSATAKVKSMEETSEKK